jgi:hypothetical protein
MELTRASDGTTDGSAVGATDGVVDGRSDGATDGIRRGEHLMATLMVVPLVSQTEL